MSLEYEFLKIMDDCVRTYNEFLLPAILCDHELKVKWSNPAARKLYPSFTETRGLRQLLGELSREELFLKLKNEGTQIVTGALGISDTRINLLPVMVADRRDEPVGVIVIIVEGGAVSTQEALLKRSQTPYSLERSIRWNVEKMFEALDLISHKAELIEANWIIPGLDSIARNGYSVLRIAENVAGYMQMTFYERDMSFRYTEIFSHARLIAPVAVCKAKELGVNLTVDIPESEGAAACDIDKLQLAFINLLHNALRFAGGGGEVTVKAAEDRERDTVSVTVTDNGPGIPKRIFPDIFKPYFTWPNSEKPSGMGLGLTIAKMAAEAHGGRLDIVSEEGQGVTATMSIPRGLHRQKLSLGQGSDRMLAAADRYSRVYTGLADL